MKQYRITAEMFNPAGNDTSVPDAYVDPAQLREYGVYTERAPSITQEIQQYPNKGQYQREHNIKPGTDAWFELWFGPRGTDR
jgi:hypothetical protein